MEKQLRCGLFALLERLFCQFASLPFLEKFSFSFSASHPSLDSVSEEKVDVLSYDISMVPLLIPNRLTFLSLLLILMLSRLKLMLPRLALTRLILHCLIWLFLLPLGYWGFSEWFWFSLGNLSFFKNWCLSILCWCCLFWCWDCRNLSFLGWAASVLWCSLFSVSCFPLDWIRASCFMSYSLLF